MFGFRLEFRDARAKQIVFVPHCALNKNSRSAGAAESAAAVRDLIEGLMLQDIGIIQMPCPELLIFGLDRGDVPLREELAKESGRVQLRSMAREIISQIDQYRACGIRILGILGKDGSPTCGVDQTWIHGVVPGTGLFIQELRSELEKRQARVPIAGYCDSNPRRALEAVDRWLASG